MHAKIFLLCNLHAIRIAEHSNKSLPKTWLTR